MRWNVGFVGFGFIGKVHALAYRSLPFYYDRVPGEYRLARVATSRPETARAAKERFGFDRAATDWREVIDDPAVQIVHVAQPNAFHREVLLAAMDAGKHIYCEKPLGATWADAEEVAAKLPRYGGISQMCLQNRFFAATIAAAELVRCGFLGDILCFRGKYLHSGILDPKVELNWKAAVEYSGGGVILDLGPHLIDILQVLCGAFEAVFAEKRIALSERTVRVGAEEKGPPTAEDHAVLLLKLPGGVAGSAEVSKVATGTQDELSVEVHGTCGGLAFDLMAPGTLRAFDQMHPELGWQHRATGGHYRDKGALPGKMAIGWVRAHIASLYNFLSAVARGEPTRPDLRDGADLQGVLEAAYRSAEKGAWHDVLRIGQSS